MKSEWSDDASLRNATNTTVVLPRYLTYAKVVTNLLGPPMIIIPVVLVIMVIVKNRQMRNNKTMFIINLLVADISFAMRTFILNNGIIFLYFIGQSHIINCTAVTIMNYFPTFATNMMFLPLGMDRLLNVAFPFSYKRIMTPKVVITIISSPHCWWL